MTTPTQITSNDERIDAVGERLSELRDQFPRVSTDADSWWLASELLTDAEILSAFAEALADAHPDVIRSIAARLDDEDRS